MTFDTTKYPLIWNIFVARKCLVSYERILGMQVFIPVIHKAKRNISNCFKLKTVYLIRYVTNIRDPFTGR